MEARRAETEADASSEDHLRARAPEKREHAFRSLFDAQYGFMRRLLRRLGVPEEAVDDATQELFVVAARRLDDIQPGCERPFLFGVARRVASSHRRNRLKQAQLPPRPIFTQPIDEGPNPEQALQDGRARQLLDELLDSMEDDTREVFILFELEELSKAEIATLLGIPEGTAASRLRRARAQFLSLTRRMRAAMAFKGVEP